MIKIIKKILKNYISTSGKKGLLGTIFFAFIVAFLSALEPYMFTRVIVEIETYLKTGEFDFVKTGNLIMFWGGLIIVSIIIHYIYRYFFVYKLNMKNYVMLCKNFNDKIVHMEYSEYLGKKQGSLYKIYDRGTQGQESFLYFFFGDLLKNVFGITIIIIILFNVNTKMALIALSMLPVMVILGVFFVRVLSKQQKELNDGWDNMFGVIGNILSSFILTKSLNIEKTFLKSMSGALDKLLIKQNKVGKGWSIMNIYTALLVMTSRILVIGFGVYLVVDGDLLFAELFLIFSYIGWIYFPVGYIIDRFNDIVKNLTSVEKMYDEFDNIIKEDIYTGNDIKDFKGNIQFKNIDFSYVKGKKIIQNLNLEIKSGEKIAFVGNTGSGKSTITNLLLRFWELNKGGIYLDSENIANLSKKSLRSHIGIVSQDNSLFNLSIKENLLFANPKATKKDLEQAIKKAEAHFVFDLEFGINTVIGERGGKLSGGEKQRLSIARLFLKNPEILILDEATSALDNKTEKLIQKALDTLMKGRTSIVIAHRLSTIQNADKIFMLEKGQIVEEGNYTELMKKKDKFYNLANPDHLIIN